ncbi:hypothetical protein LV164_006900 [Aspergillus fumigatus]|nr:hypothetical protein KXX42_007794 [Aspergillus fumigatus]KAH1552317.1 hypothetical protein KXX57_007869 [Aspergillus fumigatus]KAH1982690.1 hypothetical protein KXW88_004098 [Aspergillus fumigatus]KAH2307379.1 hypothetical protein KXV47_007304 [Aspergillus fumigatus]KAH2672484.1 hypothetical protein KXV32_000260 [Aspergillus fumigatus]
MAYWKQENARPILGSRGAISSFSVTARGFAPRSQKTINTGKERHCYKRTARFISMARSKATGIVDPAYVLKTTSVAFPGQLGRKTATTIFGQFDRFSRPRNIMAYQPWRATTHQGHEACFHNLTLHEPADTSVEGSRTLAFLNRLAATSQATELIRVATAEGYDTEPDGVTTTAPETRLQIQGRMTLSAVPPTYNAACQALALEPIAHCFVS